MIETHLLHWLRWAMVTVLPLGQFPSASSILATAMEWP
jgi:hypothetical protein